jgi:hypothetical protein
MTRPVFSWSLKDAPKGCAYVAHSGNTFYCEGIQKLEQCLDQVYSKVGRLHWKMYFLYCIVDEKRNTLQILLDLSTYLTASPVIYVILITIISGETKLFSLTWSNHTLDSQWNCNGVSVMFNWGLQYSDKNDWNHHFLNVTHMQNSCIKLWLFLWHLCHN